MEANTKKKQKQKQTKKTTKTRNARTTVAPAPDRVPHAGPRLIIIIIILIIILIAVVIIVADVVATGITIVTRAERRLLCVVLIAKVGDVVIGPIDGIGIAPDLVRRIRRAGRAAADAAAGVPREPSGIRVVARDCARRRVVRLMVRSVAKAGAVLGKLGRVAVRRRTEHRERIRDSRKGAAGVCRRNPGKDGAQQHRKAAPSHRRDRERKKGKKKRKKKRRKKKKKERERERANKEREELFLFLSFFFVFFFFCVFFFFFFFFFFFCFVFFFFFLSIAQIEKKCFFFFFF
jgi:uncharacterized membrane protein